MIKTDLKDIYRLAWEFSIACPVLFLIPVLVEMAQHVVELQNGMYVSKEGAQAAEQDRLRLMFGLAKVAAIMAPGYWFTRYIGFGRSAAEGRRIAWPAIGLWGAIFLANVALSANGLFGTPLGQRLGIEAMPAKVAWEAGAFLITALCVAWFVAWALGNARIGPLTSARMMWRELPRYLLYFVVGFVPLMVVHYGLAIFAVLVAPNWLDWVVMMVDALVVGWLALTLQAPAVLTARRASERSGIPLLPVEPRRPSRVGLE